MTTMATTLPVLTDATLTLADGVATLTLCRNDVRNALTGTHLAEDITTAAEWINRERSVSVLVLTGSGSAFSSGGNVKDMLKRSDYFAGTVGELAERYRAGIQRMALAMQALEVPSLAAVNGAAIGAGFDLSCMCDVRIAADTASMGETFLNFGLIPGDGGAWFLQRLIGYNQAADLTFTGRIITAAEARQLGIVLECVAPEQLQERAAAWAHEVASKPPHAVRLTKRLMKAAQRMALADFLDQCALAQGVCHHDPDHSEAVAAFVEKRAPRFASR